MNSDIEITTEELRRRVRYDAETGQFFSLGMPRKNGGFMPWKGGERPTGSPRKRDGYIQMSVCGRVVTGHRLAWFYTHGRWPGVLDHINGDPADNRIANLREVTQAQNTENLRSPKSNNGTGFLGVSFDATRGKFFAKITVGGRQKALGRFETAEEAHCAYLAAKRANHAHATI